MAGVEGSFTNRDWTWEAYVSTGETNILMFYDDLPSLQRYQFLVAQPNWGVGAFSRGRNYDVTCSTGLPMFGTVDPDAGCQEAIQSKTRALWDLTQNIAEANLQGAITEMRNGELRFAAGVSAPREQVPVRAGRHQRQHFGDRAADRYFRVEQHGGLDGGGRDLRRAAGSDDGAPGSRARLSLFGLRQGRRRRHLQDARQLVGDRERELPRRLSVRDARAEHRGVVRGSTPEHGLRLHLQRPVPGVDDRALGQPGQQAQPESPAGTEPLPRVINRSDTNPTNDGLSAFDTNSGSTYVLRVRTASSGRACRSS